MTKFSIEFVKTDEGSGWVLKEGDRQLNIPLLTTREEAVALVVKYQRAARDASRHATVN